ncbi:MAG TPA: bifunctional folylpolyglutamate synthase/dihydrofolate synthase, partial [Flavisolibacter sp.]|nr:bifunctional folylpolyglutamate synthase/dihydrofolate synthase [Flavisolibacter sp.]
SMESDLPGIYQAQNIRTVLTAISVLKQQGWNLDDTTVTDALKTVKQKTGLGGRWELIQQKPTIVLEVAHNENGIQQMLAHLRQLTFDHLHLVIGVVKDKDTDKVLSLLPTGATYYFTQAAIPRALLAVELKRQAEHLHLSGDVYDNVNLALDAAKAAASENDLILVCGSIFLVAEVDKSQYVI